MNVHEAKILIVFYFLSALIGTLFAIWIASVISWAWSKIRRRRMTVWVEYSNDFIECPAVRTPAGDIFAKRDSMWSVLCLPDGNTHCHRKWIPGKGF